MRQDKGGVKKTNLFELFATITLDDSGYKKGLDDAVSHTSKLSDSIKSGLATAAKVGTAAITVAATGIAALTKASVQNYAEYEQLVGGAQLMFGDAYDFIADKAKNAYSTVQMSQNEYLQQVNGFATGLKTALGGNEQAAAELADRIINAEADIVAATGNTAENVQNAFNGIMKSNYTMLDNLQLGITPTKEGFQEVIDKVNEWNAANGNATNYMIDNLADAQNALVDYIEMQGLAGYAANEASKTISGSLASAKAAWSNLVTGVADDNADFGKLLNNFVNSVSTAAKNLVPRVKTAITGIGQLISQTLPIIVNEIPAIIKDVVPELLNAAMDLVSAIGQGLLDNSVLDLVMKLVDFIIQGLPEVLNAAFQIIETIGNGLVEYAPKLITSVSDVIIKLAGMLTNPEQLNKLIDVGLTLVSAVGQSLIDHVGKITDKIPEIVQNLVDVFLNPEQISKIIDMGVNLLTSLISNTTEIITVIVNQIPVIIDGIVSAFTSNGNLEKIIGAGFTLITSLFDHMPSIIATLAGSVVTIIDKLKGKFAATDWSKVGENIAESIWNGITKAWTSLVEGVKKLWEDFTEWFESETNKSTTHTSSSGRTHGGGSIDGSHFGGLEYVPFDGYIAELHKGEMVLTADEAKGYSKKEPTVINQYNSFGGTSTLWELNKANQQLVAAIE